MTPEDVLMEAGRLAGEGKPYALATVVNVLRPASTRRGDRALITPDGGLVGWVGGACSEPIVIREALRALADGEPRLVRICPAGVLPGQEVDPTTPPPDPRDRLVVAESHCASEGTVEVLVEPQLPRPLLAVVGDSPAALTLAEIARTTGWRVSTEIEIPPPRPLTPGTGLREADAVVVATMGRGDEEALAAGLATSAGYVGLVASARRASVVLEALGASGLDEDTLARIRSPAGLDLGPSSQEEIAVAVLAELVAWRHTRPGADPRSAEAVDPVCGMTISTAGAQDILVHDGAVYYFCSAGCRERFETDPTRYSPVSAQ